MKQNICVAIIFFFFSFQNASAQNIDSTIARYANEFGQERMYIHYDKSAYCPGETVWFKTYIMKTIFPSEDSKSVYIDWTDDKGNLLLHIVSAVVGGTSFGQFEIPAKYTGQFIHVKAYTKWMLNFDSAFLYNKDIRILTKTNIASVKKSIIPEITFFPEGGDAIAGVTNKIAFKANDQWGRPINVKGIIKNKKGKIIDSLRVIHDGMGFFYLRPEKGDTFIAIWKDEKGAEHTTSLPAIKEKGVSLQVAINGTRRTFLVSAPPQSINQLGLIHIIGTMYQQEVFKVSKELNNGAIQEVIPTENLPSGILTITVFDKNWNPLAERITYINNEEYLFYPEMTVQHWGLNKRARNEIEISVPDSLSANLSVSVTDMAIASDTSDNIISHLLLTGELKGKVNDPAYYFLNNSDSLSKQLDLVMLTHGWRRFNWEEIVKGNDPKIIYPKDTSYLSISGKIYGATPNQLRGAGSIVLLVNQKKSANQVYSVPVNPDGTFRDPSHILFDTAHVYYQFDKSKGLEDVSVQFMQNRLPPLANNMTATSNFYNFNADTTGNYRQLQLADATAEALKYYKGKVLETVTIKGRSKSPVDVMDEKYTSGLFSGGDAFQFDLLTDPSARSSIDIFNYLQGKVAGLQINTSSHPPTLQWRGGTPQIFLDETPSDANMISSIPVSDVAYIKVLRPPFIGGIGGGGAGAIAIYTRHGDDVKSTDKGLNNNIINGYTAIRQFYSPDYSKISEENEKQDLRTTLYWNPMVITNGENNKVLLTFYNNDVAKSFRVEIEGMTKDGRLAHVVQVME
ncbi:MAG: hypothetical protein Q8891_06990 [Bacteroidota bacterium]|nr:hypothetical protein [Bacteroidota bacterium]